MIPPKLLRRTLVLCSLALAFVLLPVIGAARDPVDLPYEVQEVLKTVSVVVQKDGRVGLRIGALPAGYELRDLDVIAIQRLRDWGGSSPKSGTSISANSFAADPMKRKTESYVWARICGAVWAGVDVQCSDLDIPLEDKHDIVQQCSIKMYESVLEGRTRANFFWPCRKAGRNAAIDWIRKYGPKHRVDLSEDAWGQIPFPSKRSVGDEFLSLPEQRFAIAIETRLEPLGEKAPNLLLQIASGSSKEDAYKAVGLSKSKGRTLLQRIETQLRNLRPHELEAAASDIPTTGPHRERSLMKAIENQAPISSQEVVRLVGYNLRQRMRVKSLADLYSISTERAASAIRSEASLIRNDRAEPFTLNDLISLAGRIGPNGKTAHDADILQPLFDVVADRPELALLTTRETVHRASTLAGSAEFAWGVRQSFLEILVNDRILKLLGFDELISLGRMVRKHRASDTTGRTDKIFNEWDSYVEKCTARWRGATRHLPGVFGRYSELHREGGIRKVDRDAPSNALRARSELHHRARIKPGRIKPGKI